MSAPSYADSPRNPSNYLGQSYRFTPTYIRKRNPTSADIRPKENQGYYPIGSIWVNTSTPPEIWILSKISSTNATTTADWVLIANSLLVGPVISLSDSSNTVVPPSVDTANPPGNVQLVAGTGISVVATPSSNLITITNTGSSQSFAPDTGTNPVTGSTITLTNTSIVAAGTLANAIRSNGTGSSTIAYQVQYAGSNAGSSASSNWGVAQFDSNQFNVSSGFVQLAGGVTPVTLGIVPDAHTSPGTTPVVPNGSGNLILEGGATFATGTQAHPIRTNSLAANTIDLQIQLAGSNAGSSTANDFGVSQFDSNSFSVSSGFVKLANGGTTGAVTGIEGDDSNLILPSSGVITLNGDTVANGTNAKPVYFAKNSTSAEYVQVQISTTSTSAAKSINNAGLSSFNSTQFTVDSSTGFVSLMAGGVAVETLTGNTGGAISPSSGNINTVGTGSITVSGTGSTLTTQLTGLTNHAVLVGAGTATITNVGPSSTSGQVLQSQGSSSDPAFSTATYPATTTINQILYSSSSNTVAGLTTANDGVLTTGTGGAPSITQINQNGQLIIGSSSGAPAANTLTAGTGITITNGANSITIASTSTVLAYKNVNHGSSPYTVLSTDYYLSVDCSAGTVTLNFQNTPTTYQTWVVKDRTGNAATYNISITTPGGTDQFDGSTTYKITSNYGSIQLIYNGTNYEVY